MSAPTTSADAIEPSQNTPHGFFHTLVIMGSALALGCGGISHDAAKPDEGHDENGAKPGATGGFTASGGTGGISGLSAGTGGVMTAAGGNPAGGGRASASGLGGGASGAGPEMTGAAGELACPEEQWTCDLRWAGSSLPPASDCACDYAQPKRPRDCQPGQTFVCRGATNEIDGSPLVPAAAYDCHCTTNLADCRANCEAAFGEQSRCLDDGQQIPSDTTLCDCAVVLLK